LAKLREHHPEIADDLRTFLDTERGAADEIGGAFPFRVPWSNPGIRGADP
jgi:hypothetical protein